MYSKKILITKAKIRYYLNEYQNLNSKIKERELNHILYSPSLRQFKHNINTIENQVISMEEDSKLQEMKFYKAQLDKHLHSLKVTQDIQYYNFILWNYIKKLPKKEIQKRLGNFDIKEIEQDIIDYLFFNMIKEA